jgi:phosphoribosylformylglycinamidine cyclo-ligase
VPPIFGLIREVGHVAQAEMDQTFNSGLGMIVVLDKKAADGVLGSLKRMNEQGFVIGEIRRGTRGASFF